jgi:hypothetical protein
MQIVKHQRKGGSTWVVGLDVHEVPDLGKLPAANASNKLIRDRLYGTMTRAGEAYMQDPEFYLGSLRHLDEVGKMFVTGWKEGGDKALKLADGLVDKVSQPLSIRRRTRYSDDGDEFDRERLLAGHLEQAWRTTSRQVAVATPIINIACAWGGNCDRSHDQLFWSGAAGIALVRILEAAGYQTSLTAVCTNDMHSQDKGMVIACRVKQAGEYLRADAVASTICFAPTFRTFVFLAYLAAPYTLPSGLGHQCAVDILLPHANEAGARQAVQDALAELQAANLAALPEAVVEVSGMASGRRA